MITVYHNSGCSKCRATEQILKNSGQKFKLVEYLNAPPTIKELDALLTLLAKSPEEIVRTGEDEYESLNLKNDPPQNREAWLKVLVENPILIERPIVTNGKSAVIGRPPENISAWLSKNYTNSL